VSHSDWWAHRGSSQRPHALDVFLSAVVAKHVTRCRCDNLSMNRDLLHRHILEGICETSWTYIQIRIETGSQLAWVYTDSQATLSGALNSYVHVPHAKVR
jgi:hypothetical protein